VRLTTYDIECIENARKIIDADISRHFTIEYLAGKAGVGKTKLKKLFKEYFGSGLFTYLQKQRMIKAAELIINTKKPIKEIAKAAGYKYPSNFITAFTAYYGVSPSKYRNYFS
jgi:AraC-like DNA-binding protein